MTAGNWQKIAADLKDGIASQIPSAYRIQAATLPLDVSTLVEECGLLTAEESSIITLDATALRDAIAAKTYTAVAVTTAYLKAAAVAHQATNCLMDYFPEEALARAKNLDDELERTGKTVGPLHGVPVSVKDHLGLKGHELTAGFASWVGKNIPAKDGTYVAILRDAGAVFYCKTTLPQAIMHLETDSFLGPTVNPFNRNLTCGGSSGGEGALIGAKGSVLGIGTDIGGSIRNPAALCGIYGFKPTATRLPKGGNKAEMVGQEAIAGAIGPMGRSVRDLELSIEILLAAEPWKYDSTQVGMSWRPEEVRWKGGDRPRIGVMWHDGVVKPQPPMARAMKEAVQKLVAAGFEVVDYEPFRQAEGWDIISSLYFTDGGERIRRAAAASGEPILPLTQWIMSQNTKARASIEVFELVKQREGFRADYNAHFLASNVDVVIMPPGPGPAPVIGTSRYWGYTSILNLVDYPAGILPYSFVTAADAAEDRKEFLSGDDKQIWAAYDPETFIRAPLSLQVFSGRWEDEKVIKAMEMIDKALA